MGQVTWVPASDGEGAVAFVMSLQGRGYGSDYWTMAKPQLDLEFWTIADFEAFLTDLAEGDVLIHATQGGDAMIAFRDPDDHRRLLSRLQARRGPGHRLVFHFPNQTWFDDVERLRSFLAALEGAGRSRLSFGGRFRLILDVEELSLLVLVKLRFSTFIVDDPT